MILKDYLEVVVDLEKDLYFQDETILALKGICNTPSQDIPSIPIKPHKEITKLEPDYGCLCGVLYPISSIVAILGAFYILGCIVGSGNALIGIFFFIPFIIMLIYRKNKEEEAEEASYRSAAKKYNEACKKYDEAVKQRQQIIDHEQKRKMYYVAEIEKMSAQRKKTNALLQQIYDLNIVYPKYRNFVMICSILEYIQSGRCTSLEGHEGAYNLLEMEVRMDRIILELQDIRDALNRIAQNQHMLYTAIKEVDNQVRVLAGGIERGIERIYNSLQSVEGTMKAGMEEMQQQMSMTAYTVKQSQKELHYMNRMDYWTGKNDGVFDNIPPN